MVMLMTRVYVDHWDFPNGFLTCFTYSYLCRTFFLARGVLSSHCLATHNVLVSEKRKINTV